VTIDSKELFYLSSSGQMIAAAVESSEDGFRVTEEKTLFSFRPFQTGDFTYDVTKDGSRFLVLQPEDQLASTRVSLVLNWTNKLASR
jgi:hypothetical protein